MDPEHPLDVAKTAKIVKEGILSEGIPSTAQITEVLEAGKRMEEGTRMVPDLSETGEAVAKDLKEIMQTSEQLLKEKNQDDALQEALSHANEARRLLESEEGQRAIKSLMSHAAEETQVEGLKASLEEGSQGLIRLVKVLAFSEEFRQLLWSFTELFQRLVRKGGEMKEEWGEEWEKKEKEREREREREREKEKNKGTQSSQEELEQKALSFSEAIKHSLDRTSQGSEWPKLDEEVQEKMFEELFRLIRDAQRVPEYQQALGTLLENSSWIWTSLTRMPPMDDLMAKLHSSERSVLERAREEAMQSASGIRKVVERLANASLDPLLDAARDFAELLKKDQEARQSLESVVSLFHDCLWNISDERRAKEEAKVRLERARQNLMRNFGSSIQRLLHQLQIYLDRIRKDRLSKRLAGDLSQLTHHLFYDEEGQPMLKTELLSDLQKVLSAVLHHLHYLKIPDFAINEEGLNFVARDIVLNIGDLAPHHLKLVVESDIPEGEKESARNKIQFEMSRIHAEAHNIRFAIDKTSLPPLTDTGFADFSIYGDGMKIFLDLSPYASSISTPQPQEGAKTSGSIGMAAGLQVVKAKAEIDQFDLNVYGSGRDWMYFLLGPYIRRVVRRKIEESVCEFFLKADLHTFTPLIGKD